MPSNNVRVDLYHANWCGHCVQFQPEWEKLKRQLEAKYGKGTWREYEESANKMEIEQARVKGYPTIRISGGSTEKDYIGERTADAIMNYVDKMLTGKSDNKGEMKYKQCGGGRNQSNYYEAKYLKYKAKYMKLKSQ